LLTANALTANACPISRWLFPLNSYASHIATIRPTLPYSARADARNPTAQSRPFAPSRSPSFGLRIEDAGPLRGRTYASLGYSLTPSLP
jgi:hypothetical protein